MEFEYYVQHDGQGRSIKQNNFTVLFEDVVKYSDMKARIEGVAAQMRKFEIFFWSFFRISHFKAY